MRDLKPGDLVFVGPAAQLTDKVVWTVESVYDEQGVQYAALRSGMTERRAIHPVERLTRFTPRVTEPAR